MEENIFFILIIYIFSSLYVTKCGYPPIGNEVLPGSVLLPASRRGRYLANIVRRQAVDGTGIKFNKDADRINAESKKKVDVLSDELLPYIIAEQERRTTLYKRVMTAIQNGEKGVTIAEIRNKPPALIRKGLMYRCPTNRPPKEPDGSGIIMCDGDIDPSPIMYESCLSAEDKELYVAENRFFFCNRHRVEGPDLPRNGSTVIGCAPIERTSLNYTTLKCTLEDSEDVVVHYRYYPDRTYKFVTELDPDREICDRWNPCQVGYIYSLPSPDQATQSSELWHDYQEKFEDYERDEIIPPIPEDSMVEDTMLTDNYFSSRRRIPQQPGYKYHGIGKYLQDGMKKRISTLSHRYHDSLEIIESMDKKFVYITMKFVHLRAGDAGTYYARFEKEGQKDVFKEVPFLSLNIGLTKLKAQNMDLLPGQRVNTTSITYSCSKCIVRGVMLRAEDGSVVNLDSTKYRVKKVSDVTSIVELDLDEVLPQDLGDYFLILQNDNGTEERIKALRLRSFQFTRMLDSVGVNEHFDRTVNYTCEDCELSDIICRSETVLGSGRITVIPASKIVNFNFPGFEDTNACVYLAVFKKGDTNYTKIIGVIEMVNIEKVPVVAPPEVLEQFEQEVQFWCQGDCIIDKIVVNSVPIENQARRNSGAFAYYMVSGNTITIRITEYTNIYEGVFQAIFMVEGTPITKTIMEIGEKTEGEKPKAEDSGSASESEGSTEASGSEGAAASGGSGAASGGSGAASGGSGAGSGGSGAGSGGDSAGSGGEASASATEAPAEGDAAASNDQK